MHNNYHNYPHTTHSARKNVYGNKKWDRKDIVCNWVESCQLKDNCLGSTVCKHVRNNDRMKCE